MLGFLDPSASILDLAAERVWSASELEDEKRRRAQGLSALGVGPGATVAVLQEGSPALLCDLFAIWSIGAVAACLDPSLTEPELQATLDFLRPAAVATTDGCRKGDGAPPAVALGRRWAIDDPALILFTSGTTADPKAVVLSFRAILTRLSLNRQVIGEEALRRALLTLPLHFGHGLIGNALTPLAAGGTLVMAGRGLSLASNLGGILDEHRVTFMSSVPAFWRMALKTSRPPSGLSLERVHVGSAPLSSELWERIATWSGCEVFNCYGMTETANWFSGVSSAEGCADNLVGRPWGGRAGVIDADGTVAAVGEGEIAVLTPSVMTGYLDRPDLTAAALAHGWYRTGDIGVVKEDGRIVLTGRTKDEINHAGSKIQPMEIDRVVESHEEVAVACTFAIPDAVSGEVVGIAVELLPGASGDITALRAWCAERLRPEARPERWFVVADIPRTARGKLSREQVRLAVMGSA
jgi:acyl-CoA synthetase (AMP-forming)/AMP-acid ligase II